MMPRAPKPTIAVVHSLPGRVRLRLSEPPEDLEAIIDFVGAHPGMGSIRYTPRSGSLLIEYDAHAITAEEITLRTAFRFAIDRDARPVRLLAAPEQVTLENSAVLSGIGLLTVTALRWFNPQAATGGRLDSLAGVATALSVIDHGWRELRTRGYFDPEVLALAYLAASFVRGNVLTASMVTWAATFGRHLVETPSTGVVVEPIAKDPDDGGQRRYELVVAPDTEQPDRVRAGLLGFVNSALRYAMSGGGAHGLRSFWEELQDVSRVHGEVLEGFSRQRDGIPIRFR